jgi:hypothetical protein
MNSFSSDFNYDHASDVHVCPGRRVADDNRFVDQWRDTTLPDEQARLPSLPFKVLSKGAGSIVPRSINEQPMI